MANVLFVHNNFPGQFGFLASELVAEGHRCMAIASKTARAVKGVEIVTWAASRGTTPNILREAIRVEADFIRGGAAAAAASSIKQGGFIPDLIIGHPGWGETTYLREIFPKARQIVYAEYYYRSVGGDVGFDPEFPSPQSDDAHKLYAKNAGMALAYAEADAIVAPTAFQRSLLPPAFRSIAHQIHEGVDTSVIRRHDNPRVTLPSGRVLDRSTPVITLINRRLEPLRGFHIFMRALPAVLAAVPNAEVLIIGADARGGYGKPAPDGQSWGRQILAELGDGLPKDRVHFTGPLPHPLMLEALMLSWAHVYYTYPFVMSWSLLEAMALECLVIGSDTAPVRDAIENGENGILLDFLDVDALSAALIEACRNPTCFGAMRCEARQTIIRRYERTNICLPAWRELIGSQLVLS